MTNRHFRVLERIFAAEISGRLPYQFNRKNPAVALELEGLGLIRRMTRVFDGRFAVTCHGWELTPTGHREFCQHCADVADAADFT